MRQAVCKNSDSAKPTAYLQLCEDMLQMVHFYLAFDYVYVLVNTGASTTFHVNSVIELRYCRPKDSLATMQAGQR